MADANTTRYAYVKPEVGASADTWGGKLNQNFDDLDAITSAITTTGSANAYVLTTGLSLAAYVSGQAFKIKTNFANTGAATINVDTLGAKSIVKNGSTALASGDLASGQVYEIAYDGTNFQLVGKFGQTEDADLTAIAALGYTSGSYLIKKTAADTWSLVNEATYAKTDTAQTWSASQTFDTASVAARFNSNRFLHFGSSGSRNMLLGVVGTTYNGYIYGTGGSFERNAFNVTLSTGVWDFSADPTNQSAAIRTAGKTAVPIPASAMVPNTTNGPSAGLTETTTNKVMYRTLDFDTSTQESAQFLIPMPKGWDEGAVTFQACWTAASGSGGVAFDLAGLACSDDDALDTAFGTAQQVTDTFITAGDVHWTAESSAITIAGSPAENDLVLFRVRRVPADAADTLGVDAKLIAIRLFIATNAKNDA